MSAKTLLKGLLAYQAWANDELLETLAGLDPSRGAAERHAAIRLMNHIHVVSRIFAAHLEGVAHGYAGDNAPDTPEPHVLRANLVEVDRWYLDHLETISEQALAEPIAFTFTDGDKGCMTRQEMLTHVVLHGGYHRGEVGRMLAGIAVSPPWDTYAVHLHRVEPARRLQGGRKPAEIAGGTGI
ncbi:damage-inducible protein DinB [Mesorhizobium sp. M2A.F.Ca.ET.037.01.1.1]|uniref:DinB family protein n=1 Tax=unclassified Mesorhizobium TaxID=325217 RepID=UPI000F75BD11|nr:MULTISPECIES: DinB family protein [unclassified Mesorhizobium]RUY08692.1 damage-inducible protein DinB [Mesorhizobium sp. M2A.F.Ca.ET.040.01.1.1]RVC67857.1 damage-inducible protein DinB [Mesorhizobium sp. M00.F.Ca.ET.038.03.1.1]AZO33268.1 damage-inducible protein DinB [Mesorhizobium sp. M2A.F.Ca.ET.046.03.2.1]RUX08739.1 damage-inducible protein DinB [Mesorhizobium sp. M2A.F.Ca.ET.037.01.1.1]RWA87562.1 MAG: damage-inducible protein DinB [Mesorhizobium sp.]